MEQMDSNPKINRTLTNLSQLHSSGNSRPGALDRSAMDIGVRNGDPAFDEKFLKPNHELKRTWSTWEELLLAFAVKRHGFKDWDTISMELQARTSSPVPLTAQICKDKYHDLKCRFTKRNSSEGVEITDTDDDNVTDVCEMGDNMNIPWLEELRQLRVAELRQEVHHSELSIHALQMKKKKLEESKEGNQSDYIMPDVKKEISENNKRDVGALELLKAVTELGAHEDSNKGNQSYNESNSMMNRETEVNVEVKLVEVECDIGSKSQRDNEQNSYDDSSDRNEVFLQRQERNTEDESVELEDSMEEFKEESDVQSSASFTRKKRQREDGGEYGAAEASPNKAVMIKMDDVVKVEMLIRFFDVVKSHKHGSVFEHQLNSQKMDSYKNLVRQHLDLETVQNRINDGSYSSCLAKFYLDVLLIFSNAIVFFPRGSPESVAAYELRDLLLKELKKIRSLTVVPSPDTAPINVEPKTDSERSDSLFPNQNSKTSIVACRKGSSVSFKNSACANSLVNEDDEKPLVNPKLSIKPSSAATPSEDSFLKLKLTEKPVTGIRRMRSSRGRVNDFSEFAHDSKHFTRSTLLQSVPRPKEKGSIVEKEKTEVTRMAKRHGAADSSRKNMKISPSKGSPVEVFKSPGEGAKGGKREKQSKKEDKEKVRPVKRTGGAKKVELNSPSKKNARRVPKGKGASVKKRVKEDGGEQGSSKRPKKRSR